MQIKKISQLTKPAKSNAFIPSVHLCKEFSGTQGSFTSVIKVDFIFIQIQCMLDYLLRKAGTAIVLLNKLSLGA